MTYQLFFEYLEEPSALGRVAIHAVRHGFGGIADEMGGLPHHGALTRYLPRELRDARFLAHRSSRHFENWELDGKLECLPMRPSANTPGSMTDTTS